MCTRPKKGFPIGLTPDGKTKYAICDHIVEHVEVDTSNNRWLPVTLDEADELRRIGKYVSISTPDCKRIFDWIPIPCGKCDECRLQKSKEWANRLMMEMKYSRAAYFLTLTYNDVHVPKSFSCDPETGEAFPVQTLQKKQVQDWLKRLRKAFAKEYGSPAPFDPENPDTWYDERRVRYYLCGEYGGQTYRPHYHVILFSPPIPDADFKSAPAFTSETGSMGFNSDWLTKTWSDDLGEIGFITYSEVTWKTCAYVARYCLKKRYGAEKEFYTVHNIEPEFSLQSVKPGIGWLYYMEHPDLLQYEYITLGTENDSLKFAPPRYFRKLQERYYGEDARKAQRLALARKRDEALLVNTTLSYEEHMEVRERNIRAKLSQLKRGFEDAPKNAIW